MNGLGTEGWDAWDPDGDGGDGHLPPLDALSWRSSYDRESIERFAAEVAAEERRLQIEIDAARARAATASAALAPPADRNDFAALMLAVQDELDALEEDHRRLLAEIRSAAEAEAARVLASARDEVAAVRRTAASFSDLVRGGRSGARHLGDPAAPGGPGAPEHTDVG